MLALVRALHRAIREGDDFAIVEAFTRLRQRIGAGKTVASADRFLRRWR